MSHTDLALAHSEAEAKRADSSCVLAFENPKRIDVFITHSVLEMPQVQDKYDKQNLQSILDQLTEFLNAQGTFGDQHTLNQSRMIYDIAAKFWCEEADRMGAKYKTLDRLLIRVRKLYQNAISYEHRRKTSKSGTETEKPKTQNKIRNGSQSTDNERIRTFTKLP